MATDASSHQWRFFRAGGFDQVKIETGADLAHLGELDQKLWVALACPIAGLHFDERTAALIDTDKDGRIRAPELIAAATWAAAMLKNPDLLIEGGDTLPLEAIDDGSEEGQWLLASARRILESLGQAEASAITLEQAMEGNSAFARAAFNGDGVITAQSAEDPGVRAIVNEIIECAGSVEDASGQDGVNQERAEQFFAECAAFDAWSREGEGDAAGVVLPAGDATEEAVNAVHVIKAKVDDYFSRCRLAAFDPRLAPTLNRKEEDYAAVAAHDISLSATETAAFPLAHIAPGQPLPLDGPVNPAHAAGLAALRAFAVRPLLGARAELTEGDWITLLGKLEPYEKWQAAKAGGSVEKLGLSRVRELLATDAREKINALIARDKALEGEAAAVGKVEQLVRYVRDLRLLCRNFVSFEDLYGEETAAIFQVGVLYLDRRECLLCLTVGDATRHAAMAGLSGAYLAYCDCVRKGSNEKMSIVAVISQGDDDNLMAGRNGLFYDRQGRDYDATITKIIASPISLREAFWSPYKKLARMIEEYAAQKAATAQSTVSGQMAGAATGVAAGSAPAAPATPAKRTFDPSVVALFSVAFGSLAAAFAAVMGFLGKFPKSELPLMFAGIALLVSLPSVIIAYIKLHKRSLGPILDASGWAINAKASVNVPFGNQLTRMARLPAEASVDSHDLYRPRAALWPKFLAGLFCLWWVYAILSDSGILNRLTSKWETPLGTPPANLREHAKTNTTASAASATTNNTPTNAAAAQKP